MKKTIIAAAVLSLLCAGAAVSQAREHWLGYIAKTGSNHYGTWQKIEIFRDNNGCQYLVATGGTNYSSGSYGVSITPRINSATKEPHCS